jgi:hypothetical protein
MTRLEVEITPDSMQTRKLPKLLYFNNNPNARVYFTWKFNAENGTVASTITTTTSTTKPTTTTTDYIDIDSEPGTEYDSSEVSSLETDQSQYDEESQYDSEYDSDSEEDSSSNEDYGGKRDYDSGYRKKRDVPTEINIVQEPQPKLPQPCIINAKHYAATAIAQAILQFVLPLVFWAILSNTQHYGFADTLVIAMYILAVSMNLLGIHTFTRSAQPPFWDLWMYFRIIMFLDIVVFLLFVMGCASAMDDIEAEDEEVSEEGKGKNVKKASV